MRRNNELSQQQHRNAGFFIGNLSCTSLVRGWKRVIDVKGGEGARGAFSCAIEILSEISEISDEVRSRLQNVGKLSSLQEQHKVLSEICDELDERMKAIARAALPKPKSEAESKEALQTSVAVSRGMLPVQGAGIGVIVSRALPMPTDAGAVSDVPARPEDMSDREKQNIQKAIQGIHLETLRNMLTNIRIKTDTKDRRFMEALNNLKAAIPANQKDLLKQFESVEGLKNSEKCDLLERVCNKLSKIVSQPQKGQVSEEAPAKKPQAPSLPEAPATVLSLQESIAKVRSIIAGQRKVHLHSIQEKGLDSAINLLKKAISAEKTIPADQKGLLGELEAAEKTPVTTPERERIRIKKEILEKVCDALSPPESEAKEALQTGVAVARGVAEVPAGAERAIAASPAAKPPEAAGATSDLETVVKQVRASVVIQRRGHGPLQSRLDQANRTIDRLKAVVPADRKSILEELEAAKKKDDFGGKISALEKACRELSPPA